MKIDDLRSLILNIVLLEGENSRPEIVKTLGIRAGDTTPCVIASTASPYKFAADVLPAVKAGEIPQDGFVLLEELSAVSDTKVPAPLAELKSREVLHKTCVNKEDMAEFIKGFLG